MALLGLDSLAVHELTAERDEFICVGRHSEASLQAPHAASLSLRHVLIIPMQQGPDLQLDIVPLSPTIEAMPWPLPLPPPLDSMCTALLLGDALLLVAPPPSATQPVNVSLTPGAASNLECERPAVAQRRAGGAVRTRVTSVFGIHGMPEVTEGAAFTLVLRSRKARVALGLREEWLDCGIVLGRMESKCSHAALASILSDVTISRCHMFLRREGDRLAFYDTASTSGVFVDEVRMRRYELPARRARDGESSGSVHAADAREHRYVALSGRVFVTAYPR